MTDNTTTTTTTTATTGQNVKVHYKGTLDDGTVFDDSRDRGETLDFEIGTKTLLPDFEAAVVGMGVGETKTFNITEGYGPHRDEAVINVPTTAFPDGFDFIVGNAVQGTNAQGQMVQATITTVTEEEVTLDHNHPLAGQNLNFEVELVEIL
jgi:peptidylprolyl isomerase